MADPRHLAEAARGPQATLKSYDPTVRERLAAAISGDTAPGSMRRWLAGGLVGGVDGRETGILDYTPAGLLFADEGARDLKTPGQRVKGALTLGAMALPLPAAAGAARAGGKAASREAAALARAISKEPAPKVAASLTAEHVPYGSSGYDIHARPPAERQAYTQAAPWTDAAGHDRLSGALGYQTKPTQHGHGYWQPESGPPEINPVQVHRPQVALTPEGQVAPQDEAAMNFMQGYRGLNDVQAGTPWHVLGDPAAPPSDAYSLNLGRQPDAHEMGSLNAAVAPGGGEVWNASDGVTLKTWGDPAALHQAVQANVPGAVPRQTAGGGYIDLSEHLAHPGEGRAVGAVLEQQAALGPEHQASVSDPNGPFQQLSQDVGLLRGERARQFGVDGVRPDFDLLWKLQAQGGWNGVKAWIDQNGAKGLPVLAGWLALHEQQAGAQPQPTP